MYEWGMQGAFLWQGGTLRVGLRVWEVGIRHLCLLEHIILYS